MPVDLPVAGKATLSLPSDTEFTITREFDAPRELVWEAMTRPEHVRNWFGPHEIVMRDCEIDLRVGGGTRYVTVAPDGSVHTFTSVFLELDPPHLMVSREKYEPVPESEHVATVTLDDLGGARTRLVSHHVYDRQEERDGHLNAGMEPGMQTSMNRLEELLAGLRR